MNGHRANKPRKHDIFYRRFRSIFFSITSSFRFQFSSYRRDKSKPFGNKGVSGDFGKKGLSPTKRTSSQDIYRTSYGGFTSSFCLISRYENVWFRREGTIHYQKPVVASRLIGNLSKTTFLAIVEKLFMFYSKFRHNRKITTSFVITQDCSLVRRSIEMVLRNFTHPSR